MPQPQPCSLSWLAMAELIIILILGYLITDR